MKAHDILYIIFTALILSYPLYEKLLIKDEYRARVLYYGYLPLAIVCVCLMVWTIITANIESRKVRLRLTNQEIRTESLRAESLKISSIEIRTTYKFEYRNELNATFKMMKANPIKTYLVNSKAEKNSIPLVCDDPKVYFPGKHTVEFKFRFTPETPSELYGKSLGFLEKYDKIYFPWKSFTHFLALLKVGGGTIEQSTDPFMAFQVLLNGRVLIAQEEAIKNIDPSDVVLIFQTEPDLFKNIETRFMDL
jgi:hypothetical protein